MRVGLVTTSFPRFDGDCSGVFLLTMARGLVAQGHQVRVLAPEPRRRRTAPAWPGIDLRWVPYARPRCLERTFYGSGTPDNLRARPLRWLGAAAYTFALERAARRELTDCDALVSSWCIPSGWVAAKAAAGRPHLCICHATDVRWLSRLPFGGRVAREIGAGSTAMWFLSPTLRDAFFETAGMERPTMTTNVGPMPIAPPEGPRQSRTHRRKNFENEGFTLLFMGRLVRVKGVAELLEALASVRHPVALRIAGDGPERPHLEQLAHRLGVDARFEGWVSGRRKEELFDACDSIVVPSRPKDGLPTVLFEARAREIPIIATDLEAIPLQLRGHPGVTLVPPNDEEAMRRAIARAAAQGRTRSVPLGGR